MRRANRLMLERLKHRILPQPPKPRPDMTGWTNVEIVQWEFEQLGPGGFVKLVEQASAEREAEEAARRAEEAKRDAQRPEEERATAAVEPAPGSLPAVVVPAVASPSAPPLPTPEQLPERPLWREVHVRWRLRGPQDYDWDDGLASPGVRSEYDVLGDDDEDRIE